VICGAGLYHLQIAIAFLPLDCGFPPMPLESLGRRFYSFCGCPAYKGKPIIIPLEVLRVMAVPLSIDRSFTTEINGDLENLCEIQCGSAQMGVVKVEKASRPFGMS